MDPRISASRRLPAICAVFATVVALYLGLGEPRPSLLLDDAYLTLHNADVLLSGEDLNYNVSGFVGATSPVHLLLVSVFGLLFDLERSAIVVGCLALGLYVWGLVLYTRRLDCNFLQSITILVVGCVVGVTPLWIMNGLETGLGMAVAVWLVLLSDSANRGRAFWLLAAVSVFVRPELGLLAVFLAMSFWPGRAKAVTWLSGVVMSVCMVGSTWIILYTMTGVTVLDTARAKMAFFAESGMHLQSKFTWVGGSVGAFLVSCGMPALGILGALKSRTLIVYALWCVVIIVIAFVQFPGSLAHNSSRYLAPVVPLIALGTSQLFPLLKSRVILFSVTVALIIGSLASLPDMLDRLERSHIVVRDELAHVAIWCDSRLDSSSVLIVHDAGYIAYATDFKIVDMVGLKTRKSADLHRLSSQVSGGRTRIAAVSTIALESGATHLIVFDEWDQIFEITGGLQDLGWGLEPVYIERYTVYKLTPP